MATEQIVKMSDLAKSSLMERDYNRFMAKVNCQQWNEARLFVEDKIDNLVFTKEPHSFTHLQQKYRNLKELDTIVTQKYINQIEVNGATKISKQ